MSEFRARQESTANNLSMKGGRCKLCSAILNLDVSKIRDFYEALMDRSITNATIVEVLDNWEIPTSISTISIHRTGRENHARHIEILRKAIEDGKEK